MSKTLVVLSGGQDSTTVLFLAKYKFNFKEAHAVTFDYGQRHRREIEAARTIAHLAREWCASHEIIPLGNGVLKSTSPLTDNAAELEQYKDHQEMEKIIGNRVEKTFVPMRNALFLTIAANRAVARSCGSVMTGVCEADNANYPDCRQSFVRSMDNMFAEALGIPNTPVILAPLIYTTKSDSINIALQLPGCYQALGYSHTAYDGTYPPRGSDHATVLRAHSFYEADVPDPLIVRAWLEGLCELPDASNYSNHNADLVETRKQSLEHGPQFALLHLERKLREMRG